MSPSYIIAGFVISTIGFSLFLFGKKQQRVPQLCGGMAMMGAPLFVHDPLWIALAGVLIAVSVQLAVRMER